MAGQPVEALLFSWVVLRAGSSFKPGQS